MKYNTTMPAPALLPSVQFVIRPSRNWFPASSTGFPIPWLAAEPASKNRTKQTFFIKSRYPGNEDTQSVEQITVQRFICLLNASPFCITNQGIWYWPLTHRRPCLGWGVSQQSLCHPPQSVVYVAVWSLQQGDCSAPAGTTKLSSIGLEVCLLVV